MIVLQKSDDYVIYIKVLKNATGNSIRLSTDFNVQPATNFDSVDGAKYNAAKMRQLSRKSPRL